MHLLEILATVGVLQGLLLLLLIGVRYRYYKNLPLALLVIALSLRLGTIPSWSTQSLLAHPWLFPVTTPLPFLFGFLVWWYTRELRQDTRGIPPRVLLHVIPWFLDATLMTVIVLVMSGTEYARFVELVFTGSPPFWMTGRNILKVTFNLAYMTLAVRVAFAAKELPRDRLLWLRAVALVPLASLVAFAFVALAPGATAALATGVTLPFTIVAATLLVIIYTVSLLALLEPGVLACGCPRTTEEHTTHGPDAASIRLAQAIQAKLDAEAFRDPELSLRGLAEELRVHPNRLSLAINHACGVSFPKLVNRYRLDFFLRRVREGALTNENILELAFDAGFPSKSTFNRVFKSEIGSAPSLYVATIHAKNSELDRCLPINGDRRSDSR